MEAYSNNYDFRYISQTEEVSNLERAIPKESLLQESYG
jgi:hypothetical protein